MYKLIEGDCIPNMDKLAKEGYKSDLVIFSPPFASLYSYSQDDADMGNSKDSDSEFMLHYEFFAKQLFKVVKEGRNVCVHLQQVSRTKADYGHMGLFDIRGYVNKVMQNTGFILYGEVCIPKSPQAQSITKRVHQLQFKQWERDSTVSRPALADWLQIYKMPGTNQVPVKPLENGLNREGWIKWANTIWQSNENELCYPASVWFDINETHCLNNGGSMKRVIGDYRRSKTKFRQDEKHMCPLQIDLIERCVLLWSNKGEDVFTPFAGIGSELVGALMHGRRATGIELNENYIKEAARNCKAVMSKTESESRVLQMF